MLSVYAGKPLPPPFASCTCWTVYSNDAGSWKMAMTRGRGWINGVQLDANESFRKGNYETELSLESWRRIDLNFERAEGILRSTKFEKKKYLDLFFFFNRFQCPRVASWLCLFVVSIYSTIVDISESVKSKIICSNMQGDRDWKLAKNFIN